MEVMSLPQAMERFCSTRSRGGYSDRFGGVVYRGNRAYEKLLMELDAFAIPHGLKVIAGQLLLENIHMVLINIRLGWDVPDESDCSSFTRIWEENHGKIQAADSMDTIPYPETYVRLNVRASHFFLCFAFEESYQVT